MSKKESMSRSGADRNDEAVAEKKAVRTRNRLFAEEKKASDNDPSPHAGYLARSAKGIPGNRQRIMPIPGKDKPEDSETPASTCP